MYTYVLIIFILWTRRHEYFKQKNRLSASMAGTLQTYDRMKI